MKGQIIVYTDNLTAFKEELSKHNAKIEREVRTGDFVSLIVETENDETFALLKTKRK